MTAPPNPDPTAPSHTTPGPPVPPRAPKSRKRLIIGLSAAAVLIVTLIATAAIGTYIAVRNHNQNVRDEATREKVLNELESLSERQSAGEIPVPQPIQCPPKFPVEPGSRFTCIVFMNGIDGRQFTSPIEIKMKNDGKFTINVEQPRP